MTKKQFVMTVEEVRRNSHEMGVQPFTGYAFLHDCVHCAYSLSASPQHEGIATVIELILKHPYLSVGEGVRLIPPAVCRFSGFSAEDLVSHARQRIQMLGTCDVVIAVGPLSFSMELVMGDEHALEPFLDALGAWEAQELHGEPTTDLIA